MNTSNPIGERVPDIDPPPSSLLGVPDIDPPSSLVEVLDRIASIEKLTLFECPKRLLPDLSPPPDVDADRSLLRKSGTK
jgi:hypothetical protein